MDKPLRHQQARLEIPNQKPERAPERAEGPGYRLADQVVVRVDLEVDRRAAAARIRDRIRELENAGGQQDDAV